VCPRYRIQAAIGTAIVTAIANSIVAGGSFDQLVPKALRSQPAGSPRTTMPRNIETTIST
jgi:hypothetical protein